MPDQPTPTNPSAEYQPQPRKTPPPPLTVKQAVVGVGIVVAILLLIPLLRSFQLPGIPAPQAEQPQYVAENAPTPDALPTFTVEEAAYREAFREWRDDFDAGYSAWQVGLQTMDARGVVAREYRDAVALWSRSCADIRSAKVPSVYENMAREIGRACMSTQNAAQNAEAMLQRGQPYDFTPSNRFIEQAYQNRNRAEIEYGLVDLQERSPRR